MKIIAVIGVLAIGWFTHRELMNIFDLLEMIEGGTTHGRERKNQGNDEHGDP